ncbi:MAG: dihydropteroate synthase [Brevinematales bacterium]|nr:dihydropteroate synthase [Brevinematales bacterium]
MFQITSRYRKLYYDHPILMGILNLTEDSFFDGGRYKSLDMALKHTEEMIKYGAEIIDVGGESTRPGAEPVPEEEEMDRVIPVVDRIAREFDVVISVDTYKSNVAEEALKNGAEIINDISGFGFDSRMKSVIKNYNAIGVIMHIKGTPKTMQQNPVYTDVVSEVYQYFIDRIEDAVNSGINKNNLIIDPGIGFGKKLEHNIALMKNLEDFKKIGLPILLGVSRKSIIGALLDGVSPEERLNGTLAANLCGYLKGANILRIHDVKAHKEFFKVFLSLC